ncbi:MAG: alpha-glucan family phosphorylase, partial [Desulfobacteraceae bacterium]|nr:alpha-glucan family phosphorylase [Desulfobacteraceae bacterium]
MIASNKYGTFFGVKQETLDAVWTALTDPAGHSVTYVSMEIGADNDAHNPVKDRLQKLPFSSKDARLKYFANKFLHDPGKIPNYSG